MADMTETQVEAHYSELIELVRAGRMSYYDKAAELARRNGLSIAPLWRVREEGVNNQLGRYLTLAEGAVRPSFKEQCIRNARMLVNGERNFPFNETNINKLAVLEERVSTP